MMFKRATQPTQVPPNLTSPPDGQTAAADATKVETHHAERQHAVDDLQGVSW